MSKIHVGCELFVRKGDMLLLGKRKNCYGAGTWALPGGHLEFGETMAAAACREAKEELDADVYPEQLELVSVVDDIQPGEKHYIHASFELKEPAWEPALMEPDCCEEWRYFPLDDLPTEFFEPHKDILVNYLKSTLYKSAPTERS